MPVTPKAFGTISIFNPPTTPETAALLLEITLTAVGGQRPRERGRPPPLVPAMSARGAADRDRTPAASAAERGE